MIRIRYRQKGKTEKQILIDSKKAEQMTKEQLLAVGYKTKNEMIKIIEQNSKNPASPKGLRKSIKLYPFPNGGWGIGRIDELPTRWKATNYGHSGYGIQVKNAQYLRFKDKEGKIIYRKSVNNHAITAMNFLEKSIVYLMSQLSMLNVGKR